MSSKTLLNQNHPGFAIYNPDTGNWRNFEGGKLEISDDDPDYAVVMAEAARNPNIAVYNSVKTCVWCGENFGSKAEVEAHVKDIHFDKWLADRDADHAASRTDEIKRRAGVFCDACSPPQEYPNDEALAEHVKVMHTAPPTDADRDEPGGGESTPTEVPAAKPSARARAAKA